MPELFERLAMRISPEGPKKIRAVQIAFLERQHEQVETVNKTEGVPRTEGHGFSRAEYPYPGKRL